MNKNLTGLEKADLHKVRTGEILNCLSIMDIVYANENLTVEEIQNNLDGIAADLQNLARTATFLAAEYKNRIAAQIRCDQAKAEMAAGKQPEKTPDRHMYYKFKMLRGGGGKYPNTTLRYTCTQHDGRWEMQEVIGQKRFFSVYPEEVFEWREMADFD